ncbi:MAG TPA: hypothetical protein VMV69_00050 [Pirellulales bacterium]|nr:hypothetical protein [Pirellulales bacterium]
MQAAPAAVPRWPRVFAAALIALFSWCPSIEPPLRADDNVSDGDYDGYEDVKDSNGKPIYAGGLVEGKCGARLSPSFSAGKFATADDERFFAEFFDVKIGEMTWKKNRQQLPDLRYKFKQTLTKASQAPAPDVHDKLNAITLAKCRKIAADERYPRAARVNCMNLIGELNQQEKREGDPKTVVALADARNYLLDAAADAALHDALRVEAMVGLKRHAETNLAADARKSVKDRMLQLLSKKNPPPGKIGPDWIRMQAADILGILASKGDEAKQPDVSAALLAMAAEADIELWMRCQVVGNLKKLDKSFPADKILPAARRLAGLVVEIATLTNKLPGAAGKAAEVKPVADAAAAVKANKKDDKSDARKKKADKVKKEDAKDADPKKDDENAAPVVKVPAQVRKVTGEELTFCLSRIRSALTGREVPEKKKGVLVPDTGGLLSAANDPNTRKFIEDLVANVDKMLLITANSKLAHATLVAELEKARTELEQWLKTAGVSKPAGKAVLADKAKSPPAVGRAKNKSGVNATVGSE